MQARANDVLMMSNRLLLRSVSACALPFRHAWSCNLCQAKMRKNVSYTEGALDWRTTVLTKHLTFKIIDKREWIRLERNWFVFDEWAAGHVIFSSFISYLLKLVGTQDWFAGPLIANITAGGSIVAPANYFIRRVPILWLDDRQSGNGGRWIRGPRRRMKIAFPRRRRLLSVTLRSKSKWITPLRFFSLPFHSHSLRLLLLVFIIIILRVFIYLCFLFVLAASVTIFRYGLP